MIRDDKGLQGFYGEYRGVIRKMEALIHALRLVQQHR